MQLGLYCLRFELATSLGRLEFLLHHSTVPAEV